MGGVRKESDTLGLNAVFGVLGVEQLVYERFLFVFVAVGRTCGRAHLLGALF
jgi:hypothetical protein